MKSEKIIILGAGVAGLYSGYLLNQQGYTVQILEARDRVGGRTYTIEGVDLGGSWVSTIQPRGYNLCKKFNLELIPQYEDGKTISQINNNYTILNNISNIKNGEDTAMAECIQIFEKLSFTLDYNNPFYQELDKISVYNWLQQNIDIQEVRLTIGHCISALTTSNIQQISMLFWLYFLRSCKNFESLANNKGGAQEFRIEEGAQEISNKLSENLDIQLNNEVIKVQLKNNQYEVITKSLKDHENKLYIADKIICTIPLSLVPKIDWSPKLENKRIDLYSNMQMGNVSKFVIQYDRAFWRDDGYSGECISNTPPITVCFDGCTKNYVALIVFIAHIYNDNHYWSNQSVLEQLSKLLKNNLALYPSKIHRKDWQQDEFSGGCYFCFPKIGYGQLYSHIREPFHNIHFAGTETANEWYGYIEGALESAERVFNEITSPSTR